MFLNHFYLSCNLSIFFVFGWLYQLFLRRVRIEHVINTTLPLFLFISIIFSDIIKALLFHTLLLHLKLKLRLFLIRIRILRRVLLNPLLFFLYFF